MVILQRFIRFFELHFGWFFVNGQKSEKWEETLKSKYGEDLANPKLK